MVLSVFRSMKQRPLIKISYHYHQILSPRGGGMRLTWPQHLQTARTLELSGEGQRGEALALMGIALLMLAQDLLDQELDVAESAGLA